MSFSSTNTYDFYTGDGSVTAFVITFEHTDSDVIVVEKWDITDPDNPTQSDFDVDVDYTVASATVTCTVAPTADEQILIYRETPDIHDIPYSTYQFPYNTVNTDFDQVYQRLQELEAIINRTVKQTQYEQASSVTLLTHADLVARLESIEADVADHEIRVDAAEASIINHEIRIADLEA